MKPFLLLATRAEDAVADSEYRQFLRFGGLTPEQLVRVRLEAAPLGDQLPGLDLTRFSGVIVGGSPFTSSDATKSAVQLRVEGELAALLDDVLKLDIPFLGACYGIATLGLHAGGVVDTTYGETASAIEVTLTEEGVRDPLLAGVPRTFLAYVGHKEALLETPPGATLLASGTACPVQMFRVGTRQYATQFHPELDVPGIAERIRAYAHMGYFVPDSVDALIEAVSAARVEHPSRLLANFVALFSS